MSFWRHLVNGTDLADHAPSRKELLRPFFGDSIDMLGETNHCGYLEDVDLFDPDFSAFRRGKLSLWIPSNVSFEVAYQACENAGYSIASSTTSDTGVFIGNSASEYYRLTNTGDALLITGNSSPFICGRLSYWLNLKRPQHDDQYSLLILSGCVTYRLRLHTRGSVQHGAGRWRFTLPDPGVAKRCLGSHRNNVL